MRLALLQYNPSYLEVTGNLNRMAELLDGIEADLVVLPELSTSGYFFTSTDDAQQAAEPVPEGPTTQRLIKWAKRWNCTFVAGLPEQAEDLLYNSAVVVSPEGYVGTYRKMHLYYEEKKHFSPGTEGFPVFELQTAGGEKYRLGVMVCFDWYFPESARTLALKGADLIAHPSNLVRKNCPRAMPIRALENHCFTATANRTGQESNGKETLTFIGKSTICQPDGQQIAQAGRTETTVLEVTIDPSAARDRQLTAHNHIFADRRPKAYALAESSASRT